MKSETLEEQRARLEELSRREKEGLKAVQEGQIVAPAGNATDPNSVEGKMLERHSEDRVRASTNDTRTSDDQMTNFEQTGAPSPKEDKDQGAAIRASVHEGADGGRKPAQQPAQSSAQASAPQRRGKDD